MIAPPVAPVPVNPVRDGERRRIYIMLPGATSRFWRVLPPGQKAFIEFPSEGAAVQFAMTRANESRRNDERLVDVFKETASGGWVTLPVPAH